MEISHSDLLYIAVIHKEPASGYGVSFPDVPGVTAVADTIAGVMREAGEDWKQQTGSDFPAPRSIDELRADEKYVADFADGFAAVIPLRNSPLSHAAE